VAPLPKILILTTGGTVCMLRAEDGHLEPCEKADVLLERIPELHQLAEIEILPMACIDSSNLRPSLWAEIARASHQRMEDYDGFVVTHGTDTLCYTAAALSFMLQELPKPVVFTGAQIPLGDIGTDARRNLINALRVATADIAEVVVIFGDQVIRGTRAKKTSAFDVQAITSVNAIPLAKLGLTVKWNIPPRPRGPRKPLLQPFLQENVAMLSAYPGLRPEVLEHLAETHAGIVLEGFGAGNLPGEEGSLIPAIRAAAERNVPVVVCTQCIIGSTQMDLYKVGRAALEAGAMPAMDMTRETTLVKLMWVLGQTNDLAAIDSMMRKSYVGEIHESA